MRYLKILGLAALTGGVLMALASTASATTLTFPTGTTYTGTVTIEEEVVLKLDGAFATVECSESHIEFDVEQHGAGVTVAGKVKTHSLGGCNFAAIVKNPGTMEIHAVGTGTHRTGTLTSSGTEVSISTSVGTCVFTTNATHFGTITPTNDTGGHATLDTESAKLPRTGGNFLCGSSATMTGSHTISKPEKLWIDS